MFGQNQKERPLRSVPFHRMWDCSQHWLHHHRCLRQLHLHCIDPSFGGACPDRVMLAVGKPSRRRLLVAGHDPRRFRRDDQEAVGFLEVSFLDELADHGAAHHRPSSCYSGNGFDPKTIFDHPSAAETGIPFTTVAKSVVFAHHKALGRSCPPAGPSQNRLPTSWQSRY